MHRKKFEPPHDKTSKMVYASSGASDQPGHLPSLIRVFVVRMKKPWVLSYPLRAQQRLWSDWADAQADLSLCWAICHFVGFVMRRLICDIQEFTLSMTVLKSNESGNLQQVMISNFLLICWRHLYCVYIALMFSINFLGSNNIRNTLSGSYRYQEPAQWRHQLQIRSSLSSAVE